MTTAVHRRSTVEAAQAADARAKRVAAARHLALVAVDGERVDVGPFVPGSIRSTSREIAHVRRLEEARGAGRASPLF